MLANEANSLCSIGAKIMKVAPIPDGGEKRKANLAKLENALLSLDRLVAREILSDIANRFKGEELFTNFEGLVVPVLEKIGVGWENGEVSLSQVYMSGRICEAVMEEIMSPKTFRPLSRAKIAIAVLEDYHMLGKRMVKSVLLGSGFDPIDYGTQSAAELAEMAMRDGVEILLVSTLMLPSALRVKELRKILSHAGSGAKIVVGGAPFRFDDNLWKEVGADATGNRASEAVGLIHKIMKEKNA
jgi:methanogenic corrinoid protein MtbC1